MSPWSAIGSAMVQRVVRDAPRLSPRICAAFSAWSAMVRTKTQINEKWRGCRYYKATMLRSADHRGTIPFGLTGRRRPGGLSTLNTESRGMPEDGDMAVTVACGSEGALWTIDVAGAVFLITTIARPLNMLYYIIFLPRNLLTIQPCYLIKRVFCL
jgi:hypothetical protein